jgi:NADH dehydrogenase
MKTISDALSLRNTILTRLDLKMRNQEMQLKENINPFVIVGAGPTGVDPSGIIAELIK